MIDPDEYRVSFPGASVVRNYLLQTANNIGGTADWTLTGATVVQSQADPFSGSRATKLVEAVGSSLHAVTQTVAKPISTSFVLATLLWVKKNGDRWMEVGYDDTGNGAGVIMNLTSGALDGATPTYTFGTGWSGPAAAITNAGGGWWRVFVTATGNNAQSTVGVTVYSSDNTGNATYVGDGSSGIFIFGLNVSRGNRDIGFMPTTTKTGTIDTNLRRRLR